MQFLVLEMLFCIASCSSVLMSWSLWLQLEHLFIELNFQILSEGYGSITLDKHIEELE